MADRTCSIDGCEDIAKARGWCGKHYMRWYVHGDPHGAQARTRNAESPTGRMCTVEGCDRPSDVPGCGRGWCGRHYQRWQKWGDPLGRPEYVNKGKLCRVDDCDLSAHVKGLCSKHYMRLYTTGSTQILAGWANAPEGHKWCGRCKSYFPLDDFYSNRSRSDGLSTSCKECDKAKTAEFRRRHPEKVKLDYDRRDKAVMREYTRRYRQRNPGRSNTWSARRRARLRNAEIEDFTRLEIADRDGWVCQICRKPISRTASWPDPRSLSIDHVVPLSAGGAHSRVNCQASHLRCNLSKHTGGTDQLRLL